MRGRSSPRVWLDRRRRHRSNVDPADPPPGWHTGPPDFVGVGVDKAGTSWWFELLVDHPDIVRPPNAHKELRYFNRFGQSPFEPDDVDRYHRLFPRPPGSRTGEWSPGYVTDYWTPPLLRAAAPEARLLVLLRDPVDRYLSALAQIEARRGRTGLAERRIAFGHGLYATHLERLLTWFPTDQVLVLQYEACADEPGDALRRTYEHVGVDPAFVPSQISRVVHRTDRPKSPITDDERELLARAYAADVQRLRTLCPSIDVDRWPSAGRS